MNERDFLPVVGSGILESVTTESLRARLRHHLHALYHPRDVFVLQHSVFAFGVLSDDGDVNLVVPGFDPRLRLTSEDVDKEIQLVPHFHVAGLDVGAVHLGFYVTLNGTPVPLDGSDSLKKRELN